MLDIHEGAYLTVAEAAKRLQVSHPTVWRWIRSGKLPAYRVGPKTIRINEADLARLVQPVSSLPAEEKPVPDTPVYDIAHALSPLTEEERQRGLKALEELGMLRKQVLQRRGGQPFPSSVEIIREMREERSRHLDQL